MTLPPRPDNQLAAIASRGTAAHEDQRQLLLELLVDPPPEGDAVADLAVALDRPVAAIAAAAAALARAGLAEHRDDRVRASPTALAFDVLWPIGL